MSRSLDKPPVYMVYVWHRQRLACYYEHAKRAAALIEFSNAQNAWPWLPVFTTQAGSTEDDEDPAIVYDQQPEPEIQGEP